MNQKADVIEMVPDKNGIYIPSGKVLQEDIPIRGEKKRRAERIYYNQKRKQPETFLLHLKRENRFGNNGRN